MKELITRQFLFDFFDGKTTSIQRKLIEEWIKDASNEEMFYSCVDEWERRHPQFAPNTQKAQQLYDQVLEGKNFSLINSSSLLETDKITHFLGRPFFWMAASVALLLLTSFIFRDAIRFKTYSSSFGQTTYFSLEDSTEVILNSNSTLKVPRFGFGSEARQVQLQGEAEFNVTHTHNHSRFRVMMGDGYQIEVLGTEFTAYSRAEGKRVYLSKGKVKLELPQGKHLYMKPGSHFSATQEGSINITEPVDKEEVLTDLAQTFYFDNTPLSEVALQIEERFQVKVKIMDKNLANTSIGGIYKAKEADALLEILGALLELEITQKSDCIELRTIKNNDL